MEVDLIRKVRQAHIRDVWRGLKKNMHHERKKRLMKNKMLDNFRHFWMHQNFTKWRKYTRKMNEINRKDTIKGASI